MSKTIKKTNQFAANRIEKLIYVFIFVFDKRDKLRTTKINKKTSYQKIEYYVIILRKNFTISKYYQKYNLYNYPNTSS
jgi:hypothetical protein